jgi:hypothetical protein
VSVKKSKRDHTTPEPQAALFCVLGAGMCEEAPMFFL